MKIRHFNFLLIIIILGTVLRCWNIEQSFWWDEIWSTMHYAASDRLWAVVSSLGYYFNNHVLYSLFCRVSISFFGESELTARLPALLMGIFTIPLLFFVARKWFGTLTGCTAAFLLAVSAFHVEHSTEARGYSTFAFFSLLSSFFYFEAVYSNKRHFWIFYALFTTLGFYTHTFMSAVVLAQILCTAMYSIWWNNFELHSERKKMIQRFCVSLLAAGAATVLLYSPLLKSYALNIGKVKLVTVDRLPFLKDLVQSLFPGAASCSGLLLCGFLAITGGVNVFFKNKAFFVYAILLLFSPLITYLLINPMFVYERYFIFALPFSCIIMACGIVRASSLMAKSRHTANGICAAFFLAALFILQFPDLWETITADRQNYREAAAYVEDRIQGNSAVISLGYAGAHFSYYASVPVDVPESYAQFLDIVRTYDHVWCLVTAWLPELRPPHEDRRLYAEKPEQVKMYAYVKKHFRLIKKYNTRFPTKIYYLQK